MEPTQIRQIVDYYKLQIDKDSELFDVQVLQELDDLEIFYLYMDDRVTIDTAYDNILEKSRNCGLDPLDFYQIVTKYIQSKSIIQEKCLIKIQKLLQKLQNAIEAEKLFHDLAEKISDESFNAEQFLFQHIDSMLLFLRTKHKEMLALPEEQSKQQEYRNIKRILRDFFIKFSKNILNFQTRYKEILNGSFGRQTKNKDFYLSLFKDWDCRVPYFKISERLGDFIDEVMHFRRNYLCRFSMPKVRQAVENKISQIQNDLIDKEEINFWKNKLATLLANTNISSITINSINKESLSLFKLTFLHGTHSRILPILSKSGMKLKPVGHLLCSGFVPLSGELREGALINERSMKYSKISATCLDDCKRALSYAFEKQFKLNIKSEQEIVNQFLSFEKDFFKSCYEVEFASKWSRAVIAILRVRLMDEQFFNTIKDKLIVSTKNLKDSFEDFIQKKGISDKMRLSCYQMHEDNINSLNDAIFKKIVYIDESAENPLTYPIIFGSTTIHTNTFSDDNLERRTQKFCQLGKDIQFIFINNENKKDVNEYLKIHKLVNSVTIVDYETLRHAALLNAFASNYFADFVSSKKLFGM